ncbi:hypothetical protein FRB93_004335 [Tulasnella sp. JGI-2019a]|nr:hypothetical protein FRB93_004335 [Tulasnella sp. JGI-2019a]
MLSPKLSSNMLLRKKRHSGRVSRLRHNKVPTRHRALAVPELLVFCFEGLQTRDLVTVASVCKQWSIYAIDTLWRTARMPAEFILGMLSWLWFDHFECLYYIAVDEDNEDEGALMSADLSEWTLFIHHAHKVHHLSLDGVLMDDVVDRLRSLLDVHGETIFPNLATLHLSMEFMDDQPVTTLALLLGPSTSEVNVSGHSSDADIGGALLTVGAVAQGLQRLTLGERSEYAYNDGAFTSDFAVFAALRFANLCDISLAGWRTLAGCELLVEVILTQSDDIYDAEVEVADVDRVVVFPSLQRLAVSASYLFTALLVESNIPALRYLCACKITDGEEETLRYLADRSFFLKEIELVGMFEMLTGQVIQHLYKLQCLQSIRLCCDVQFYDMTDQHIHLLAVSLPQLHTLAVIPLVRGPEQPVKVTKKSLITLIHYCKYLKDLELMFNFADFDYRLPRPSSFTSHTLVRLGLCEPLLPVRTESLAVFLATCCPNVPELEICWQPGKRVEDLKAGFKRRYPSAWYLRNKNLSDNAAVNRITRGNLIHA